MLLIISDLHLTDGTSGTTIQADAFKIFEERVKDMAYAASWRMLDQTYEPIKQIYLLLLGDILDVIRSTKWLDSKVRPWDKDPNDPAFVAKVEEITHAILKNNHDALQVFRDLHDKGAEIPAAHEGCPCDEGDDEPKARVEVLIYYLCANHDWFYHLPGAAYERLRTSIIPALGLANNSLEVFPHDSEESAAIRSVCREHHVFARHGDIYDSNNFEGGTRDGSSLGDAVVIELVDRFTDDAKHKLPGKVPKELCEIDNVRPADLIPTWLDGLLRKPENQEQAASVRNIWNDVVDHFLSLDFVKRHHGSFKWGLRLSQGMSFAELGKIVPWAKNTLISFAQASPLVNKLVSRLGMSDDLYMCAFGEKAFNDPDISYIVYGHTHRHEVVPLRTANTTAGVNKMVYINSGTWRKVFDPAQYRPKDEEFFGYHVMTYVAFFNDHERKDRSFEAWSGSFESAALRSEMRVRSPFRIPSPTN
jgi:UDP-2,3-diacylglucosamine pyrophosphatase LpxH